MALSNQSGPKESSPGEAHRRRATLILIVVAALFVIVPFLFWRGTWFGRPLTEEELGQYLADREKPRHIQHALAQIAERIERGDSTVEHWYPQVIGLSASPVSELRITLAWLLGSDHRSEQFHRTLLELLHDPEPLVRRNAALSLVRFGDASGREEILRMLRSYRVRAPASGTLQYRLREGDSVERGTLLAQLKRQGEPSLEIRAPVPGKIQSMPLAQGAAVREGTELLVLSPEDEHAWEALRALYLAGQPEDLAAVEEFARGNRGGLSPKIQQQAALTVAEIRRRSSRTQDPTGP